MDQKTLLETKLKLESIIGDRTDPAHVERFAAMLQLLGHGEGLLGLEYSPGAPWRQEQLHSAVGILLSGDKVRQRALSVLIRATALSAISGSQKSAASKDTQKALFTYAEKLVSWCLREDSSLEEGKQLITSDDHIDESLRWAAIHALILQGLWKIKKLLPEIF